MTRKQSVTHLPGEPGIWVLVLGDMIIFGLFFCTFLYYRAQDVDLYKASQHALNSNYGAMNTIFLLTSSWFAALGVKAYRSRLTRQAPLLFAGAFVFGIAFVIVKYFEYSEKLAIGITPETNDFFMFYFIFTGIHLAHVLIGLVLLIWLMKLSGRPYETPTDIVIIESCATFWHMVDLLWVVLFPLLYLIK